MRRCEFALFALLALAMPAAAQGDAPRLKTNEAYVREVVAKSDLAIDDPMAVFAYVLGSLPERVTVYPTENHYYFSFHHGGQRYAGNIKIDARTRDQGKVPFVYYLDQPGWLPAALDKDVMLDAARGVTVEKAGPLTYRLAYKGRSVTFALNDLSQVRPPPQALAPGEQFIGPVFDESGLRFFLVFNPALKIFLYVLDETVTPADDFAAAGVGDGRILVGRRTAFALYRDGRRDRKILIGVSAANATANNYFDGPFDQIPDNFIEGDAYRRAILTVQPALAGEIDRYGNFDDGARYGAVPYMLYRRPEDLAVFHRCATSARVPAASYHRCFALAPQRPGTPGRPLALPRDQR
jgi:hypothetical protein